METSLKITTLVLAFLILAWATGWGMFKRQATEEEERETSKEFETYERPPGYNREAIMDFIEWSRKKKKEGYVFKGRHSDSIADMYEYDYLKSKQ